MKLVSTPTGWIVQIRLSRNYLKLFGFLMILFFPLVHLMLWAGSPWWALIWVLLLFF